MAASNNGRGLAKQRSPQDIVLQRWLCNHPPGKNLLAGIWCQCFRQEVLVRKANNFLRIKRLGAFFVSASYRGVTSYQDHAPLPSRHNPAAEDLHQRPLDPQKGLAVWFIHLNVGIQHGIDKLEPARRNRPTPSTRTGFLLVSKIATRGRWLVHGKEAMKMANAKPGQATSCNRQWDRPVEVFSC